MEPKTAAPSSIINEQERSKAEYSVNGINVKDLFAVKSTLTKEEIHWMIAALENCKVIFFLIVRHAWNFLIFSYTLSTLGISKLHQEIIIHLKFYYKNSL